MNSISLTLSTGQIVSAQIDRKKMKTCRLKVFPDRQIILSVPEFVSDEWATAYLEEKRSWIEKKLEVFNSTRGYASTNTIIGTSMKTPVRQKTRTAAIDSMRKLG